MAMALHVNSWVLLGVVAYECPMDILERRDFISWSVLGFIYLVGLSDTHHSIQQSETQGLSSGST